MIPHVEKVTSWYGPRHTNYTNNVVNKLCNKAYKYGVNVFHVFNSLKYIYNLNLGIDVAGSAGGFVEGTIFYMSTHQTPTRVITISIITSI